MADSELIEPEFEPVCEFDAWFTGSKTTERGDFILSMGVRPDSRRDAFEMSLIPGRKLHIIVSTPRKKPGRKLELVDNDKPIDQ